MLYYTVPFMAEHPSKTDLKAEPRVKAGVILD